MIKKYIVPIDNGTAVEYDSNEILIHSAEDALDLMVSDQSEYIILHERNFEKRFFDLSTKVLGEVLQKFANYHIKLAIIGDFKKFTSKSLHDFIYESNKNGEFLFTTSRDDAIAIWKRFS